MSIRYYVIGGRPFWDGVPYMTQSVGPPPAGTGPSGTLVGSGNLGPTLPNLSTNGIFKEFGYDISGWPLDPDSNAIMSNFPRNIWPDFNSTALGLQDNLAYNVVPYNQTLTPITQPAISDYTSLPADPALSSIEGWPGNVPPPTGTTGDHHGLWLQLGLDGVTPTGLFEMYSSLYNSGTSQWTPTRSNVYWNPQIGTPRVSSQSSADAAGLPVMPLLCTYPEVATGTINHALRFVCNAPTSAMKAYVWPARAWSNGAVGVPGGGPLARPYNFLPTGGRLRLKAAFDTSGFTGQALVILTALKKYGLILADYASGSSTKYNIGICGVMHDDWDDTNLATLANIACTNFEVVQLVPIFTGVPSATSMNLGNTIQLTFNRTVVNAGGFSFSDTTFNQRYFLSDNNRSNFAIVDFLTGGVGPVVVNYTPTQAGVQQILYTSGAIMGLNPPVMNITVT